MTGCWRTSLGLAWCKHHFPTDPQSGKPPTSSCVPLAALQRAELRAVQDQGAYPGGSNKAQARSLYTTPVPGARSSPTQPSKPVVTAMRDAERSAAGLHPPASLSLSVRPRQGQAELRSVLEPAHQLLLALMHQINSSGAQAGPALQATAAQGPGAGAEAEVAAGMAVSAFAAAAAAAPVTSPGSMAPPPPRIRRAGSAPAAAGQRKRGRTEAELDEEDALQPAPGLREAFSAPASPSQQAASPLLFRELWKQMELPPDVARTLSAPPPRIDPALLQQPLARQQRLQTAQASQKAAKEALALSLAFEAYRRLYEHKRVYGATPLPLPNNVVKLLARSILVRHQ